MSSEMKLIMENWRRNVLLENISKEDIKVLNSFLKTAVATEKAIEDSISLKEEADNNTGKPLSFYKNLSDEEIDKLANLPLKGLNREHPKQKNQFYQRKRARIERNRRRKENSPYAAITSTNLDAIYNNSLKTLEKSQLGTKYLKKVLNFFTNDDLRKAPILKKFYKNLKPAQKKSLDKLITLLQCDGNFSMTCLSKKLSSSPLVDLIEPDIINFLSQLPTMMEYKNENFKTKT